MSPDHPLTPLLREACPNRFPKGNINNPVPALDAIDLYTMACKLGARGVRIVHVDEVVAPAIREPFRFVVKLNEDGTWQFKDSNQPIAPDHQRLDLRVELPVNVATPRSPG